MAVNYRSKKFYNIDPWLAKLALKMDLLLEKWIHQTFNLMNHHITKNPDLNVVNKSSGLYYKPF
jgi:hypothetical protein